MTFDFKKALRHKIFLRMDLEGPTGSGKTYTALELAKVLKKNKRVAFIDTERSSADRYADVFDFDSVNLDTFSPDTYVEALRSVNPDVYGVTIVDSLSHAWSGKDGALEQVDKAAKRMQTSNNFAAWREVTPMHNRLVDALLTHPTHLIVTMRTKMEYVLEKNEQTGKTVPRKIGMAPVQREGLEYEFDVVGDMNLENELIITKTRASVLAGKIFQRPGSELGRLLLDWCEKGADASPVSQPANAIFPSDITVTEVELRNLVEVGKMLDKTPDQLMALSQKMYGKGPRELLMSEYGKLIEQLRVMS